SRYVFGIVELEYFPDLRQGNRAELHRVFEKPTKIAGGYRRHPLLLTPSDDSLSAETGRNDKGIIRFMMIPVLYNAVKFYVSRRGGLMLRGFRIKGEAV